MDGWCRGVIIEEFFRIYYALEKGEPLRLEPVVPYSNYIKWLEKQDPDIGLNYWREYLDGYEQPK